MDFRYIAWGLKYIKAVLFAIKLRFCLLCLEYILFTPPPMKALRRDLKRVENSTFRQGIEWARTVKAKYFF